MNRALRTLVPALLLPAAALVLHADSTGQVRGHVVTKDGKPVPKAKLVFKKADNNWSKEITTDDKGKFFQVGMPFGQLDVMITADGYVKHEDFVIVKFDDGSRLPEDKAFVMLTAQEASDARAAAIANGTAPLTTESDDPIIKEDVESRNAFNEAVPLYQDKKYADALPKMEKAYKGLTDVAAQTKDEDMKKEVAGLLPTVEKAYALTLFGSGKQDEALPLLTKIADAAPTEKKNAEVMKDLMDYYTAKKDDANAKKYLGLLTAMGISAAPAGPHADVPYNEGVKAFNAGNMKTAKAQLQKAIEIDPSFPDSYWLLGMVQYGDNNIAGAKTSFRKYLSLAPTGKHAAEVKEALAGM